LSDDVGMRAGDTTVDVNGTAAGYAQVQVLQQGRVVFSRPVPAGAFRFEAVPMHTAYADAEVVVREEGGSEQRFTIPRAAFSVSKNMASRFSMFAGKLDASTGMSGGPVLGAQYSLPVRQYLQPVFAAMVANDYVSAGAGLAANLFADGTRGDLGVIAARSGSGGDTGTKVNANLSTQWRGANPYLSLSWQGRQYRDLSESRMQSLYSPDSFRVIPYYSVSAGIGGALTTRIGAALSASRSAYYDQPSNNSMGLSSTYNGDGYTLSGNLNYGWNSGSTSPSGNAWSAYVTLRIPFKLGGRSGTSTSYYRSYGNTTGIGQSVDQHVTDNLSMGAGVEQTGAAGSASTRQFAQAFWRTPYTNASGYYTATEGSGRSYSASASGSLVAADNKLVFSSERVQDTFAIIDSGVKGYVDVDTPTSRVTTNYDGLAVAPQLFEGGSNIISIVTKTLRDGAYVKNPRQEVAVTRGAVAQVRYESNDDRVYLIKLLSDKVLFPMGSKALSGNGELIGYTVDENILMASKENMQRIASGQARVVNTSGTSCAIVADEKFSASTKSDLVEVKVSCGEGHE
jgi:outer membrane usher protein FimD/PapC